MSKKGYWLAFVDIDDPEAYAKYVAANAVAFEKYGAKFLVRGGRHEAPEEPTGGKVVAIEFDSYETAMACYHSPEYQEALKLRVVCSTGRIAIVEGV
ncbi:MAG: DUF1330 domain-containing protein [Rhizobiaceae bacterium]